MTLSREARDYLAMLLGAEVTKQVQNGGGDEPMSKEWTELYGLAFDLETKEN